MEIEDAVVEAVVRRARPVVLTALAAMLAFVPLVTDSFWGPMAYVLIGGVVSAVLFAPRFHNPQNQYHWDGGRPVCLRNQRAK